MSDQDRIKSRERNAELITSFTPVMIVLAEWPALLTEEDIVLEVAGDDTPIWKEKDRVSIGIREMLSAGVLRREGDSIVPTKAALILREELGL